MAERTCLVTFPVEPAEREVVAAALPAGVGVRYLEDLDAAARGDAVADAAGLFARLPHEELSDAEFAQLHAGQAVQFISAGVDHLPLDRFPAGTTLLSNAGAYAEPMAEHAVAMYLALAKRLRTEHRKLQEGTFDQFRPTTRVAGSTVAILGLGATGAAVTRRLAGFDVTVEAITRSGEAGVPVDFVGTPADLGAVLDRADVLVVAAPLTEETEGLLDRAALERLPEDGILVNVARGELVVQADLYAHLEANPGFRAGIDAWWTEPVRHGRFELESPFLELPNVLGSPHNSAQVPGIRRVGLRRGAENLGRALAGGDPENVIDPSVGY